MHHAACMRAFTRKSKSHISKYSDTRIHQFSCRRPYLALVRSTRVPWCVYTLRGGGLFESTSSYSSVCVYTQLCVHTVCTHTLCVYTHYVYTLCVHTHTGMVPYRYLWYLEVLLNLVPYRYLYWYSSNSRCTGTPAFSCGRFKGISNQEETRVASTVASGNL